MRVIKSNVLVNPDAVSDKTVGGVIIPDQINRNQCTGEVISVGEKHGDELSVGSRIIYPSTVGRKVVVDDNDYIVITIEDILVVL